MIIENEKASYLSPHFWWKTLDSAIDIASGMGETLSPDLSFKKWLFETKVEHVSIEICLEPGAYSSINYEYVNAIRNDYYFEVCAKSKFGHTVSAKNTEELFKKSIVEEGSEVFYNFRIDDLHGFATGYLQKWLLTNTFTDWVKWQLYFDFIVAKTEEPTNGLYLYMWSIVLAKLAFEHHLFKDVAQYKKLRDKKDEIDDISDATEKEFIRLRDLKA